MENHRDLEREIDYFVRESRSLESIQSESQSFSDATEDLIQTISAIVLYRVSARLNGSEFLEFLESFSDAKSLSSDKRSIFVEVRRLLLNT